MTREIDACPACGNSDIHHRSATNGFESRRLDDGAWYCWRCRSTFDDPETRPTLGPDVHTADRVLENALDRIRDNE